MNRTWSPSVSRGKHKSAGVFGATRDTITGVDWSEPPYTTTVTAPIQQTAIYEYSLNSQISNSVVDGVKASCAIQHKNYSFQRRSSRQSLSMH